MYIGGISKTKSHDYILEDNKIQYKEVEYVPGLIKIINEIIDNAVDEAIKTNFEYANTISVQISTVEQKITIQDNGRGIPVKKSGDHYLPELCWNHARAGSNFDDEENQGQMGTNGVGSYATAVFSDLFIGETDDGKNKYKIIIENNAESYEEKILKSTGKTGTKVSFIPDLRRFNLNEIDEIHQKIVYQRLLNLSMSFPEITFKFNNRKVNTGTFKKYVSLYNDAFEIYETQDYRFAVIANPTDDFKHFIYVNGLYIKNGGTLVDLITNNIVQRIREKLQRKYKSIKPGDIKNKLMIVGFFKGFKNLRFDSQTKERITNSFKEVSEYLGDIDYDKLSQKVLRNKDIIEPITEIYRIKEEFKKRQELKKLSKTKKKIKSEKYLPATKKKKVLFLCEGASAVGGLMPSLGRDEYGYYELRGVPLNAYDASSQKFTQNKELTELFQIAQNEDYEYICTATDADADGSHIKGLLLGFFKKYLPEFLEQNRFGELRTPVQAAIKNKKMVKWTYELGVGIELKRGEIGKYFKGLGSWNAKDLKHVVDTDGIENMISMFKIDDEKIIDDWLNTKKSDIRKEYIQENEFDITGI